MKRVFYVALPVALILAVVRTVMAEQREPSNKSEQLRGLFPTDRRWRKAGWRRFRSVPPPCF